METLEQLTDALGVVLPAFDEDTAPLPRPLLLECHGGEWVEVPRALVDTPDIYDALDLYGGYWRGGGNGGAPSAFALVTTGWAAPLAPGEDMPTEAPSAHPERRRVRLVTVLGQGGGVFSRIAFADDGSVVDEGDGLASGALADALDELGAVMWRGVYLDGLGALLAELPDDADAVRARLLYRVGVVRGALASWLADVSHDLDDEGGR